jgi:lipopolysaccharide/colanic/teichoic acid biosynthesis glycosyltransferase
MYEHFIKRTADIITAIIAIVLLSPVFIVIVVLLLLKGHRSLFFFQKRVGKNEKLFTLMKIKTMTDAKDGQGNLLPDEIRLTKLGKFIRKTSLDEMPQFINVLKGDMSFVGPRPLLVEYLQYYSIEQRKRHLVKPGITGWAQINGRNAISWEKKFELDVWYVKNIKFQLDLKIVFLTLMKIIRSEGINQQGQATMEAFRG